MELIRTSFSPQRRAASEMIPLVERYRQSGLTLRQFAERAGLKPSTLAYWLYRVKHRPAVPAPAAAQWVPVDVKPAVPRASSLYRIEWPDGLSLHLESGFQVEEARQLLDLLRPCSR